MSMYPVMLDVKGRRCLVVGGGGVALRKVQGLLESGADLTVVAPDVVPALVVLAEAGKLALEKRSYSPGEAAAFALVFAATDQADVNEQVFRDGDAAGRWVNVADDPQRCSFHLPARVRRGPLQIAVGSEGRAPFVVRRLRRVLESRLGPEWSEWLDAAERFREAVKSSVEGPSEQEACFERFFVQTVDPQGLTARVPTADEENAWLGTRQGHEKVATPHTPHIRPDGTDGKRGFVSLVGGGPGSPGLLTVHGRRRLLEADAVVYDRLATSALPCELGPEVELHPVGKTPGVHPIPQEEISALLVRLAREGKRVARLKGGDPYVFGRGGEEGEVLRKEGIAFEVVPGVTAAVAASAWAGIPVTHRKEVVSLTLVTGHEAVESDGPQVRWDLLAQDEHATIVGYMGLTALPNIVQKLLEGGMSPTMPAAMVERGTTAAQRQVVSTIADLPEAVERAGLEPPALLVIGPTVKHVPNLDWHSGQPLAGQRLVVIGPQSPLALALEDCGAHVVGLPVPVAPAARVVMGASPLTGCVVRSAADVDTIHEERDGPGWSADTVSYCVGSHALERAFERGWQHVIGLGDDLEDHEVSVRIAELVSG